MEGKEWMKPGSYKNFDRAKGFEDILNNMPIPVTKECFDACDKMIPRYLFKYRDKKKLYGHCTACNKDMALPADTEWRHDRWGTCPKCGANITVLDGGRSRNYRVHSVYVLYYYPGKEPGVITAAGVFYERDYSGDYRAVKTTLNVFDLFVFRAGKGGMKFTKVYDGWANKSYVWKRMRFCKKSEMRCSFYGGWNTRYYEDVDRLYKILSGTSMERCCVKELAELCHTRDADGHPSHVRLLDMALRYPCLEYLYKMGHHRIIKDKLNQMDTRGVVNWQGKTAEKVLKLGKQELSEVKAKKIQLSAGMLKLHKVYKEQGRHITMQKCAELCDSLKFDLDYLTALARRCGRSVEKLSNYMLKQQKISQDRIYLYELKDYWDQCSELDMGIADDAICFPRDLHAMHTELSARIQYQRDAILDAKIQKRAAALQEKYFYESKTLIMRPFASSKEIIDEGKSLKHCVGGYAKQYADGNTVLCCIRKKSAPDEPYYTIEFGKAGKMVQCRGLKNASKTEDIERFLEQHRNRKTRKARKVS